ncbi:MAG TPA: phage protease [Kiritimatiellia bacterium]|nr:phage protease [Kiritimatiellia bacterium]HSA17467.1 phage protease [Kiritimatiellia bacterium]
MNVLLPNRFEVPADGWYQVSALGEFKHNPTGLVQILDADSCRAMIEAFQREAVAPNFPGILVDFDHFSLDQDKPTEAAGWIAALEQRPDGLWAQIRWTDKGEEAIRGGRYRFISPVFRQDECTDLGECRVRPLRLVNAALTNDPNISGMVPLSNKKQEKPAAAAEGVAPAPMLSQLGRRDRALLNRAVFVANWRGGYQTDDQRKAMFARMRGGSGGSGGRSYDSRVMMHASTYKGETPEQAAKKLDRSIPAILSDAAGKLYDGLFPGMSGSEALQLLGAIGGMAYSTKLAQSSLAAVERAVQLNSYGTAARPSIYDFIEPSPEYFRWYQYGGKPQPTPLSTAEAESYMRLIGLGNRAIHLANWGGSPLTDEQRRAMFARLRGGGGGGGGGGGAAGGGQQPPSAYRPLNYAPSRDSDARIAVLEQQRNNIMASIPPPPEPHSFELIDTRALERELLRSGTHLFDIKAQVKAAEDHNQAVRAQLRAIEKQIKAMFKDPKKQKAALAAFFDELKDQDAKERYKYEDIVREAQEQINKLDAGINLERIRKAEADAEAQRLEYNADSRELSREDREALRAMIAADKAEARAAAQAAKASSPEAQARQEKQKITTLKTLWRDAANGDEGAVIRGLQKLGVNPSTVDISSMVKEATSIGVVGQDATWNQRLQARQDKANAYNRPIPGVDGEPIQVVPRSTAQYQDAPLRGTDPGPVNHNPQVSNLELNSFKRYQAEADDIVARNDRGAMPDWLAKQEMQRAWARHQQRIAGE